MKEQPSEVPPEVHALLAGPLDSFEKLEIIFVAFKRPDETWTVERMSELVRLPGDSVSVAFEELISDQFFVAGVDGYRLAPEHLEERAPVTRLCRLYDNERLLVVRVMTSLAMGRIRTSAARAFSDAFRFRRRTPEKGGKNG